MVGRSLDGRGGYVELDSDLYKPYHPAYDALMQIDDADMKARTMRHSALPLTATSFAALVSVLAGCSGGGSPAADGPLSSGSSIHGLIPKGSVCTPAGGPQTSGLQVFTNYGTTTVILDRVVLLHPHNQRLIGSYAVPGESLIGNPHGWPPKYAGMPPAWKHRQPIHGFRLSPGKTFNVVLGVAPVTTHRSASQGMLVYYHNSSGSYVAKNYWAEIIANKPHGC